MSTAIDWIAVPLSYPFMQRALVVALLAGVLCAVLSCFLVLRGWSMMGEAIAHGILPGVVLAFVTGIPLAIGAFAAGVFSAVSAGWLAGNSRVKEDAALGIVLSGMFGLGIVLFTKVETGLHLIDMLFGNLLGTESRDVAEMAIIAALVLLTVTARWRDLLLYCFDPGHARAIGLPVRLLHYGLLSLLSLVIVASLKVAGLVLAVAMLITPGAVAFLLTKRFAHMLAIAVAVAVGSSVLGTLVSFHINGATGPCIVLIQSAVFALALLFAPKHGLLRPQQASTG